MFNTRHCSCCSRRDCRDDDCPITEIFDPVVRKEVVCCDEDGRCYSCIENCRCGFWPEFSHPRWLLTRHLYHCKDGRPSC